MVTSGSARVGLYLAKVEEVEWSKKISAYREKYVKKDGPGPVMFSNTLCPAVHILGT